jgi:Zierdtviridae DNA helicase
MKMVPASIAERSKRKMTNVYATTDGKRVLIKFDYDPGMVRLVKTVPGSSWHKDTKTWRAPLTGDTCRMLRRVFKADLRVTTGLADWYKNEQARSDKLEELREGRLDEAFSFDRLAEEAPALLAAMNNRKYQLAGTAFIKAGKTVILADDPGLGKTLQTLGAVIESGARRILVACRRTATRSVWQLETMRWAPTIQTYVAQDDRTDREWVMAEYAEDPLDAPGADYWDGDPPKHKMLIINLEMVRAKRVEICPQGLGKSCPANRIGQCKHEEQIEYLWPFLFEQEWDAIIIDESHNLLASQYNYQSKHITQQRLGAVHLRRRLTEDGLAISLSGTWTRSNLTKGWGTLNWLAPDVFSSFWRWAGTHFGVEQGRYGQVIANGVKAPEPLDKDMWDAMLRPYLLRRTKAQAAPDLPPIQYAGTPLTEGGPNYVQLEMDPKQARAYHQMAKEAEANLDSGRLTATGVLAEITRARQFANAYGTLDVDRKMLPALPSNKIEWIRDFIQISQGSGLQTVIASSFSEMVELVAEVLRKDGNEVLTLTGNTSDRDRAALVARFQAEHDPLKIVVINRKAGGESITLDAADDMVVIDQPWVSDEDDQLEARIHRVSRIHQVTVHRLVSTGTVDTWMAALTEEQRKALRNANPKTISERVLEALQ